MTPHPTRAALLAFLVAFAWSAHESSAFSSTSLHGKLPSAGLSLRRKCQFIAANPPIIKCSPLHMALSMPMRPMEEEKEKKHPEQSKNSEGREWKQVVGGFVPKFIRRNRNEFENGDREDETRSNQKIMADRPYPTVQLVDTLEAYKQVVVDEADKLVVVRFFAPWCKSCKASEPLFKKLASQHSTHVKFVEVPLTKDTAYIHEGLGVPSVPFGHIYHPDAGLVEEKKINKKVFGDFREALESYVRGSCDIPEDNDDGDGDDNSFQ